MSFKVKIFGRILAERLVSVDAKFSNARRVETSHELCIISFELNSKTQTPKNSNTSPLRFPDYVPAPRNAPREMGILYQKFGRAGSSFRGSQKIVEKGGVERKLALALVRSFPDFATSRIAI